MPQLLLRRNRRCVRQGTKTCGIAIFIFAIVHYLNGRSLFFSSSDVKNDNNNPHHRHLSVTTSKTKADIFAKHFQEGFQFHRNKKVLEVNESSGDHPRAPEDWPKFFVPRSQQQYSLDYPYQHLASLVCTPSVDVLVMILSLPQNHPQRRAIRETWGSVARTGAWPGHLPLSKRLGVIFLIGEEQKLQPEVSEAVRHESEKYGDVVQWRGLQDSYYNLTMKVLLGLKWVTEHCPKVSRVIKADDDTFVHVPRLLRHLTSLQNVTNVIWGCVFTGSRCERSGRYAVTRDAYPFTFYPTHVKGNLYVLSGDVVNRLVMLAPYLPYNNMEDVHVTGTLARILGMRHESFSGREFSVVPEAPDLCLFQENPVSLGSQMVSPDLAAQFWSLFSGNVSCRVKKD